jgi:hypothetical protein
MVQCAGSPRLSPRRSTRNGQLAKALESRGVAPVSAGGTIAGRNAHLAAVHPYWPTSRLRRICIHAGRVHLATASRAQGRSSKETVNRFRAGAVADHRLGNRGTFRLSPRSPPRSPSIPVPGTTQLPIYTDDHFGPAMGCYAGHRPCIQSLVRRPSRIGMYDSVRRKKVPSPRPPQCSGSLVGIFYRSIVGHLHQPEFQVAILLRLLFRFLAAAARSNYPLVIDRDRQPRAGREVLYQLL